MRRCCPGTFCLCFTCATLASLSQLWQGSGNRHGKGGSMNAPKQLNPNGSQSNGCRSISWLRRWWLSIMWMSCLIARCTSMVAQVHNTSSELALILIQKTVKLGNSLRTSETSNFSAKNTMVISPTVHTNNSKNLCSSRAAWIILHGKILERSPDWL